MKVHQLGWLGTRTPNAAAMADFLEHTLGLEGRQEAAGFWVFTLPNGANVEVFGPEHPGKEHFATGPVAGFHVDDVDAAAAELRAGGCEIVHGPTRHSAQSAWVHFRAPDGAVYELVEGPIRRTAPEA
ncbi:glyoxalase/bleomycin resistance protein/dioxygenase superfamily protein [Murinocardiopsis flavida]|uniref:Glyoxalase/bleomycin resistance protein/dioxygenase superfamily protein n=1 Tax=Murinocardiopsis flavida TaxID=645275 RepID=A0A2P8DH25_9ACTN|nr:VOC family protein [Murinocardiopsis flavida]PSK96506.1 glyoxalase/bleomycin resistance protein/dioxygenase superfamily protein [Murinocardiopsis flavida]